MGLCGINSIPSLYYLGHILLDVFRGPLEIVIGLVYGVICGISLWYLPTKDHVSSYYNDNVVSESAT